VVAGDNNNRGLFCTDRREKHGKHGKHSSYSICLKASLGSISGSCPYAFHIKVRRIQSKNEIRLCSRYEFTFTR